MTDGMTDFEKQLIYTAFYKHLNMSPKEIEQRVGADPEPSTPIEGQNIDTPVAPAESLEMAFEATEEQKIGRQLVKIKRKKKEELTDADYGLMRKCVNYIRKHEDKPPKDEGNMEKMGEWREGLMVRGFDPAKKEKKEAAGSHDPTA